MASVSTDFLAMIAQDDEGSVDSLSVSTPVSFRDTSVSTPDATPSRRSARKKQSTFSSDFEYYIPTGKKKDNETELRPEHADDPIGEQSGAEQREQQVDSEYQNEHEEEENENEKRKPMKRKVAVKKHKSKGSEKNSGEEDEDNLKSGMGKVKVAAKKMAMRGGTANKKKTLQKKKAEKKIKEGAEDEGSNEEGYEEKVTPKKVKGQKRQRLGGVAQSKGKKAKVEGIQAENTSDEEESTPISKLKTHIQQKQPGLKKLAGTSSALAQNLMKKLVESSPDTSSASDVSPGAGLKRKLSATDTGHTEVPSKTVRSAQVDKLAPTLVGLIKRLKPTDLGLIKRSPSEIAAKVVAAKKNAHTNGAAAVVEKTPGSITLLNTVTNSSLKDKGKLETDLSASKSSGNDKVKLETDLSASKSSGNDKVKLETDLSASKSSGNDKVKLETDLSASKSSGNDKVKLETDLSASRSSGNYKVKLETDLSASKSSGNNKTSEMISMKTEAIKPAVTGETPKSAEKVTNARKVVKFEPTVKEDTKHVSKVQVIKRPDGTIVKRKVPAPAEKVIKSEDKETKVKVPRTKAEKKLLPQTGKQKLTTEDQKSKSSVKQTLSKKLNEKSESDTKQMSAVTLAKAEGTGFKNRPGLKKTSPEKIKNQKVDDFLKRGIFHKKKSHQPFGNRNVTKTVGKDLKTESLKDVSAKQEQIKKKPVVQKADDKTEVKKVKGSERRKSNDVSKHERGQSNNSSKGERRKSAESGKKSEKQLSVDDEGKNGIDDEPPPLTPITSLSKIKHRHHKSEHEVPVDMTMMDLFKPDGLVIHEQQKSNVANQDGKSGSVARKSQYSMDAYDSSTFVKPENLQHVLIEHQYSKLSPIVLRQDSQKDVGTSTATGRDDDIESVSHKQTVIMDMSLPDQILEESEEPVIEGSTSDIPETLPDSKGSIQHLTDKKDIGDRPSILESLNTELKESGTEFLIVGQVEVGRTPVVAKEKGISTLQISSDFLQDDILINKHRGSEKEAETKKLDVETKKLHDETKKLDVETKILDTEKRKLSTERRKDRDSTDKKNDTKTKIDNTEKKKRKKKMKVEGTDDKPGDEEKEGEVDDGEEHEFEDDQNDLDWEPNDPDTLYCICRMPHNNRFMICCDKCEEWFHGTCVGITKARGKEMEEKEEEYICPVCSRRGEDSSTLEKPTVSSKTMEMSLAKPKHLHKCLGWKCNKSPRTGSVYCSNECIMSHAQESLKALREEQMRNKDKEKNLPNEGFKSSSSSKVTTPSSSTLDTVEVVERLTGKVLKGSSAPTQKGLHRWLEQHPTFEVVQPHKRHRSRSTSSKDERQRDKDTKSNQDQKPSERERKTSTDRDRKYERDDKSRHSSTSSKDSGKRSDSEKRSSTSHKLDATSSGSKSEEKKHDGPNQIRINVRTALRDCLSARAQEAEDILLSGTEIKNLAVTIEEELFSLFDDTGHKYRTKYRSLIFNIKDQKNKGLFRKILTGKIKPYKLVQMSTEELASRELAKWREQANKHELEMIEKTEQEAIKDSEAAKHVIKKTHKGEVEVEDEDLSILEARLEERKDPEPEQQDEQMHVPIIDTTDQHRAHLFDLNCKVCTGKIVPGPEEQATLTIPEKVTVVAPMKPTEPVQESITEDTVDFEEAEEIVKEALHTVQVMEQSVMSMEKIISSSPKPEDTPPPPPPYSPKSSTSRRGSSSSTSSASSLSMKKKTIVRSPDSALQAGLEAKAKFIPTGSMLWKGFVSMLDVAKFFTSAYRVSGPTDHVIIPDTIHILGRISPDHMWDYLSKIRQDLTVIRFVPGNDDEKVAYVHLYSYLNSRGRCGVAGNPNKKFKDFYIVPLASHSKIPRTLLPFDGPGLEENRPHMLIGILVRQRGKHAGDVSDASSTGSGKSSSQSSTSSSTKKRATPAVNRDPRLAKLAAKEGSPKPSPTESTSSSSSAGEVKLKTAAEDYEPEYIPLPKNASKPVAEYIPTPTVKKKEKGREKSEDKKSEKEREKSEDKKSERTPTSDGSSSRDSKEEKEKHRHHHKDHHHHHHHHHHHKKTEKEREEALEDDSEPYSPGKEAEPYSPSQEAAADEPYDPGDENLMDDTGVPIVTATTDSNSSSSKNSNTSSIKSVAPTPAPALGAVVPSSEVAQTEQPCALSVPAVLQGDASCNTNELVEKMARSNDPHEISSLMVTALSTATSSQEQQKLLVALTKKVEERKLQLAEAARQEPPAVGSTNKIISDDEKEGHSAKSNLVATGDEDVGGLVDSAAASTASSSLTVSTDATSCSGQESISLASSNKCGVENAPEKTTSPTAPFSFSLLGSSDQSSGGLPGLASEDASFSKTSVPDLTLLSTASSSTSTSLVSSSKESKDTGGIKFSFTKSRAKAKTQHLLSTSTAEAFSSETTESKRRMPILFKDKLSKPSFISDTSKSSDSGRSQEIPDALKALMNDVMGNTQFSSLERRRKSFFKKEAGKMEKAPLEIAKEVQDATERQLLEDQAEMQKRLEDEEEAKRILDSLKKPKLSASKNDSEVTESTVTSSSSSESKSDVENAKEAQTATPPSIDELLDRLKKGGFQFQKADSSSTSSSAVTTTQPSSATSTDSLPSSISGQSSFPVTSSTPHTSSITLPASSTITASNYTISTTSAQDIDLRQKNDLPPLPASLPPAAASTSLVGATNPKKTSYGDYDARAAPDLCDQDDRAFYQDKRLYHPAHSTLLTNPLDKLAFPPPLADPSGYHPPLHPSTIPPPPPPPHPHFPLHPAESHVPFHKNPGGPHTPKGKAQPLPTGTEFEKPAGVLSITSDLSMSDVDLRSMNRPPPPPDQMPPPLPPQPPTQPPPPLPPPSGQFSHQLPPGDVDYRNVNSYRSHQGYPRHGRGGNRSYYRH